MGVAFGIERDVRDGRWQRFLYPQAEQATSFLQGYGNAIGHERMFGAVLLALLQHPEHVGNRDLMIQGGPRLEPSSPEIRALEVPLCEGLIQHRDVKFIFSRHLMAVELDPVRQHEPRLERETPQHRSGGRQFKRVARVNLQCRPFGVR